MYIKKNIKYSKKVRLSSWRKTAYGSWSMTGDCQVYCLQTIDVSNCLKLTDKDSSVTMTHIAGLCLAKMIEKNPVINRVIRLGSFYQRSEISIFFQVASDKDGKDLSGYTVRNANIKSLSEIKDELTKNASEIRSGNDINYKKVKKSMSFIPTFLVPFVIKLLGFIMYTCNIWSNLIGPPRDSFGSAMLTNIGSLGFQTGFAPLVPYSRVPLVLALGKIYQKPVVKNGEIVIQDSIDCCWTSDHRLIDGVTGAKMSQTFEEYLTNPERLLKLNN